MFTSKPFRWVSTLFVTGVLSVAQSGLAGAVSGKVYECSRADYGCVASTGYIGQAAWGYPGPHNCTLYAAYRLTRNGYGSPAGLGNAYEWDERARQRGVVVDGNPAVGTIAQSDAGSGHVMYVEEVHADHIVITEDNWGGGTGRARIHRSTTAWNQLEFLHFKDLAETPSSTYESNIGDFNGDGYADISLRNSADGIVFFKYGPDFASNQSSYPWAAGTNYQSSIGDFNGDGYADISLRNSADGIVFFKYGPDFASNQSSYPWAPGSNYQSVVGDFNGDGYADISLRNSADGIVFFKYGPNFASNQSSYPWAAG